MAGIPRGNLPSTAPQGQSEGRSGNGWGLATGERSRYGGDWEPTVTYLLILIVAEFVAYAALRYTFRSSLGG